MDPFWIEGMIYDYYYFAKLIFEGSPILPNLLNMKSTVEISYGKGFADEWGKMIH